MAQRCSSNVAFTYLLQIKLILCLAKFVENTTAFHMSYFIQEKFLFQAAFLQWPWALEHKCQEVLLQISSEARKPMLFPLEWREDRRERIGKPKSRSKSHGQLASRSSKSLGRVLSRVRVAFLGPHCL